MAKIGLRIDVDTFRGTRDGVPALLRILKEFSIRASFFFSVGPDNMGRHIWRLARPAFLRKMLRSRAASLYGWDILLRGAFWPGPIIGKRLGHVIRSARADGHEMGFHAWDHHAWQARIDAMSTKAACASIARGVEVLSGLIGEPPSCSAVPGWKCTDTVLIEKEQFPFLFNSDCRGDSIFRPVVGVASLSQPQVPVTLPTYDELVGRSGITDVNYNESLLALVRPGKLNVLTIHAEAEGIACLGLFRDFLERAAAMGHEFKALGSILAGAASIPECAMEKGAIAGREGWVAVQGAIP